MSDCDLPLLLRIIHCREMSILLCVLPPFRFVTSPSAARAQAWRKVQRTCVLAIILLSCCLYLATETTLFRTLCATCSATFFIMHYNAELTV